MLRETRKSPKSSLWYVLFFTIVIANIVTKVIYVSDLSIWYDESIAVINAKKNIFKVFEYSSYDNTPPVYNVFLHLWIKVFGISELAIRLPSVIFTALCAGFIFHYGQKKKSYVIGVIAATIYSLSNYNTWYAQEARCYAMVSMLSVLALIVFNDWINDPENKKNRRRLILMNSLLLYTHYLTALFIAAQGLYVLIRQRKSFRIYWRISWKTLLIFAPWSIFMIKNIVNISKGFWVPPTNSTEFQLFIDDFLGNTAMIITALVILAIGTALFVLRKSRSHDLPMLLLFTFLPLGLLLGLSEVVPLFIPRYIIYIWPFLAISIAFSAAQFTDIIIVHFIIGAIYFGQQIPLIELKQEKGQNVKELVEQIKAREKEGRVIVLQTEMSYAMFAYHYDRMKYYDDPYSVKKRMPKDGIFPFSRIDQMDTLAIDGARQVFFVTLFNKSSDPKGKVRKRIKKHHPKTGFTARYGKWLQVMEYKK